MPPPRSVPGAHRELPLPGSGRRHGDVVLHDGEPRGRRALGAGSVPVFDELVVLETSRLGTWELEVDVADASDLREILDRIPRLPHEDWTDSVRTLCAACSLGEPHDHAAPADQPWQRRRVIGVAAASAAAFNPLRRLFGFVRGVVRSSACCDAPTCGEREVWAPQLRLRGSDLLTLIRSTSAASLVGSTRTAHRAGADGISPITNTCAFFQSTRVPFSSTGAPMSSAATL